MLRHKNYNAPISQLTDQKLSFKELRRNDTLDGAGFLTIGPWWSYAIDKSLILFLFPNKSTSHCVSADIAQVD